VTAPIGAGKARNPSARRKSFDKAAQSECPLDAARRPSGELHRPVIVAMIAMRMVQSAVYEIVDMVTMRHCFMSAVRTVRVGAVNLRRAFHRIGGADRNGMFVHVIVVHMVEMTIVKIVHMALVPDRRVPAIRAMPVRMVGMVLLGTRGHWRHSLRMLDCPSPSISVFERR
jgi:hypothetical protein